MTETTEIARDVAVAHVTKCVNEPGIYLNDPLTLPSARIMYDDPRMHQCYWNDRFVVAVMCGMDEQSQRIAAWGAVSNGIIGYWEWITHGGYATATTLKHLGVVPADFDPGPHKNFCDYRDLPWEICKTLAEKFSLPTIVFGKPTLTEAERNERRKFNMNYYGPRAPL